MRRQRVNRAFETVERVMLALHHHLERFVIFVFANFACRHITNVSHFGVLVAVSESTYSFGVMCHVEVMCRRSTSPKNLQSQQLVKFLRSPATYPHRPPKVRAIQTHISWVFIASPLVFKIKKPVNLGFLDFSTLEKRHHFCQRELELNQRLAPEIYLDITPIYKTASGFSFQASGTPKKLKISTDENFTQAEPFVGKTISPAAFEAIRHFTNSFYAAKEKLFLERIQQHRIRDCHGDLHLDHIHITPETLSIFDCIEFNDRFRFIDIANDVAFLAMDFDFEGRSDLANLLLHNAAREFQDSGMLKVSDFYKCYRAFVRGKVQSIQGLSMKTTTPEEHANQAARYFRLALRYAVTGSEPLMLVITGRVATGKTMAGLPLTERTPLKRRDELYSEQTTERNYRKLLKQGLAALHSMSDGVVIDATFSR